MPKSYKNVITEYNDIKQVLNQSTARKVLTILALSLQKSTDNDLLTGPSHRMADPAKGPAGGQRFDPFVFQKCALSEKWWTTPRQV
jgi:hypothetical protein